MGLSVLLVTALLIAVLRSGEDSSGRSASGDVNPQKEAPAAHDANLSLFKSIQMASPVAPRLPEKRSSDAARALIAKPESELTVRQALTGQTLGETPDTTLGQVYDSGESAEQLSTQIQIKNEVMQGTQQQQKGTQFKKTAFNGDRLSDDSRRWDCARDIKTSLLWETKLSDAGVSDTEHTYSWYTPEQQHPGYANGGRCFGVQCDTFSYMQEMNRIGLCGSTAWRVPTFEELQTLLDRDYFSPTLNQEIFQHTQSGSYWTSTRLGFDPSMIMQIDFFNGTSSPAPIRYALSLRLVSP